MTPLCGQPPTNLNLQFFLILYYYRFSIYVSCVIFLHIIVPDAVNASSASYQYELECFPHDDNGSGDMVPIHSMACLGCHGLLRQRLSLQ